MRKSTWLVLAIIFVFLIMGGVVLSVILQQQPPITHTVQVTLEITLAPDFTPAVSPDHIITPINRTVAYNASATSVNGFVGEVVFSVSGEPIGSTVSFFPSDTLTLSVGETRGIQIDIMIPDDVNLVGTHALSVTMESTQYN